MTVNTSEAFVIVGDWISEHYFTDDGRGETFLKQIKALRKQWDEDDKAGHETPVSRFSSSRVVIQESLAQLASKSERILDNDETASSAYARLRNVLGHNGDLEEISFERAQSDITVRAVRLGETADVLWLEAQPLTGLEQGLDQTKILGTNLLDQKQRPDQPVSKLITELYLSEPKPRYIVVAAGNILFLTDRERWPEGRYLAADVQLIAERNETKKAGEIDRLLAIFSRNSLVPDDAGSIWWDERLDESQKHAVGVSKELRDGIRESIEIIANDVLARRRDCGLSNEDIDGQELARQSLRFLYRILFLLYAEAYPELGVLPKGAGEYDAGYGIDRLRELALVELTSTQEQSGTHLYESLALLFRLVNGDHPGQQQGSHTSKEQYQADGYVTDEGLAFESLEADLFRPEATDLINASNLGNHALQQVLQRLLLSKSDGSGPREFISYANLGINQLGAVYEGLMSYTGFIAETDLREVAKNGDASNGSWVVSNEEAQGIDPKHFVTRTDEETGLEEPVLHEQGSFVFRLSGRDRQQSASYYTPEVMTKFVVSQALAELLDSETPADRILELSICEPALGSGAFLIEAVRQLADEYLKRKQRELGKEIEPEDYAQELQRVKAQIALHQIYGVDLNATAVELAEVSLWLDTMQPGLHAPWFGLKLKRGNSLVGVRRAFYTHTAIKNRKYLNEPPTDVSLTGWGDLGDDEVFTQQGLLGIHHFLLPSEGWGAASKTDGLKEVAPGQRKLLQNWVRTLRSPLTKHQIDRLQNLAERVEILWKFAARRLQIAEAESQRFIDYWPHTRRSAESIVSREEIESSLEDENGAYRRLKRVMDAWSALWYWPLTEEVIQPPTLDEWISALEKILGINGKVSPYKGQYTLLMAGDWNDLNHYEALELELAMATDINSKFLSDFPWLKVLERISNEQVFMHWELEYAPVFIRGGFDLQLGNPPWSRPRLDRSSILADFDVTWKLEPLPTGTKYKNKLMGTLASKEARDAYIQISSELKILSTWLGSSVMSPRTSGMQADLYRAFISKTWDLQKQRGVIGLIHQETHLTDDTAATLRSEAYRRLRRHWQFVNELQLFEIQDQKRYSVNIYSDRHTEVRFLHAAFLYHPDTVIRSIDHDGSGPEPGIKTDDGKWNLKAHSKRISLITDSRLRRWADIMSHSGSLYTVPMVYAITTTIENVLHKASASSTFGDLDWSRGRGFDESTDAENGNITELWGEVAPDEPVILQGSHLYPGLSYYKYPNSTLLHQQDWTIVDLEALCPQESRITKWKVAPHADASALERLLSLPENRQYRIVWRSMVANSGERTFMPAIVPPDVMFVRTIQAAALKDFSPLLLSYAAGAALSIISDFFVRSSPKSHILFSTFEKLPINVQTGLLKSVAIRALKLNCVTQELAELWECVTGQAWTWDSPARKELERRSVQIEIDALVALSLNLTLDELISIYQTQFPVLRAYDIESLYDSNGRKLPNEMNKLFRKVGEEGMTVEDRTWVHPQSEVEYVFEFPFTEVDREADMRAAYEKFSRMFREHGRIIEDED